MKKLQVLLLGWDFLPAVHVKQQTGCYHIAKALAKRVDLSLILPQTDPAFTLHNMDLTGLNQVNLESINATAPQPPSLPYADEAYIRTDIPLYGSAGAVRHPQHYAGQLQAAGTFATAAFTTGKTSQNQEKRVAQPNIFAYKDFEKLSLDAQVIQYARYTCRWASQRDFDLIYAYNYMTFLAGTELKLVSGKKLILHVDALSYERPNPNSKGWMHELEKQALQKCDYILTNTDSLADTIENEYDISPAVVTSLEEGRAATAVSTMNTLVVEIPAHLAMGNFSMPAQEKIKGVDREREKESWQQTADTIWEVMQMVATS